MGWNILAMKSSTPKQVNSQAVQQDVTAQQRMQLRIERTRLLGALALMAAEAWKVLQRFLETL